MEEREDNTQQRCDSRELSIGFPLSARPLGLGRNSLQTPAMAIVDLGVKNANRLIAGNESSTVNRAVAFYRSLVGIPTGQEPPAAR